MQNSPGEISELDDASRVTLPALHSYAFSTARLGVLQRLVHLECHRMIMATRRSTSRDSFGDSRGGVGRHDRSRAHLDRLRLKLARGRF
jgi:hypothetical protein